MTKFDENKLRDIRKRLQDVDQYNAVVKHHKGRGTKTRIVINSGPVLVEDVGPQYFAEIFEKAASAKIIQSLNLVRKKLPNCCQKIFEEKIACEDVSKLFQITKNDDFEWKNERRFRVSGSRCYSLYTYSKHDWQKKASSYFWPTEINTVPVKHGEKFEPVARRLYAAENSKYFIQECGLFVCRIEPWLSYSADGIVVIDGVPYKLLEIKCPLGLKDFEEETLLTICKFLIKENDKIVMKKNINITAKFS